MKQKREFLVVAAVLAALTGCATNDFPTEVAPVPTLSADVQPIFDANCATPFCHVGGLGGNGMDLRADSSHSHLFNVVSVNEAPILRVVPGNADSSYLVIKLEGRQTLGTPMPVGLSLSPADIQIIKDWINDGAQDN